MLSNTIQTMVLFDAFMFKLQALNGQNRQLAKVYYKDAIRVTERYFKTVNAALKEKPEGVADNFDDLVMMVFNFVSQVGEMEITEMNEFIQYINNFKK